jgi:hypothetical protein
MRLLLSVVAITLGTAACSSHDSARGGAGAGSTVGSAATGSAATGSAATGSAATGSAATGSAATGSAVKPASELAQLQQWAPSGAKLVPADLQVPGIALFQMADAKPSADDESLSPKLVGVAGGPGGKILDGRDLVRAVIEAKAPPAALAQVAMWVALDDGKLLSAATTRQQRKAKVGPPAITGNALSFWATTTDVPPLLEHGKVDLATGMLDLVPQPRPLKIVIANAMTTLDSVAVSRHVAAIKALAQVCSDPRARQVLLAALGNHPRDKARAAIADEAHRCGPPVVDGLINAMERDHSGLVRREAAAALGRIGDPRARPALAKAVRGEDANLAYTAGNALKKLH